MRPACPRATHARASMLGALAALVLASASGGCGTPGAARAQEAPRGTTRATAEIAHTAATAHPTSASSSPDRAPTLQTTDEATALAALQPPGESEEPILGVDIPLYDPSGHALRAFHAALRRAALGEGQARIVVYGASHVASDLATGRLRDQLQAEFGDAGHGFVLPAQPWPHYRHLGVDVESNYRQWTADRVRTGTRDVGRFGLAGVAMTATSSRAFGRISTGERRASRFELYYWRQPDGGSLEVRIDDHVVRRVRTRADEAGPDYALFTVPDAPHTFEIRARGDGPVTIFGVSVEREVPGVVLDTLGINGARAASQLLWDEDLWREHLRRRAPDMVVLAYGTNESGDDDQPIETYEAELRRVVARVREAAPQASCLLIGPSDRPVANGDGTFAERPRTAMIVDVQQRVAADTGCGFFDLVAFGGGPLHMVQWAALDPAWAQRDHVHYTYRGYERLGDVLHGSLMSGYDGPTAMGTRPVTGGGAAITAAADEPH